MMVAVAALGTESAALGERFEKSGLPATVFADEERYVGPNHDVDSEREGADVERMSTWSDLLRESCNATQERRAHESIGLRGRPPPRLHPRTIFELPARCRILGLSSE